jgi:hypothetical protein
MRGKGQRMKSLEAEEARLLKEIDALQNQLIGVRRSIALISGDDPEKVTSTRKPRSPIKDVVIGLISEFKEAGLSVNEVIEQAQKRGQDLDRGSVSSLLSRLKREGILILKDSKYRLSDPFPSAEGGADPHANFVH